MVMYHQPAAPPGPGGAYLYQWNDDRCNMKHNFICKYQPGEDAPPPPAPPPPVFITASPPVSQIWPEDRGTLVDGTQVRRGPGREPTGPWSLHSSVCPSSEAAAGGGVAREPADAEDVPSQVTTPASSGNV